MTPYFAILVPSFNSIKCLERLLKSCSEQTCQDYCVYIYDDSDDRTIELYVASSSYNRVKYVKNKMRLGVPQNWNKLLDAAKGNYLKLMHHDEYFSSKSSLENLKCFIEDGNQRKVIVNGHMVVNISQHILKINCINKSSFESMMRNHFSLYFWNYIGSPSNITIPAQLDRNHRIRYDSKLQWFVDVVYYINLYRELPFTYIEEPLTCSLANSQTQLTRIIEHDYNRQLIELSYCIKKYHQGEELSAVQVFQLTKRILRAKVPVHIAIRLFKGNIHAFLLVTMIIILSAWTATSFTWNKIATMVK